MADVGKLLWQGCHTLRHEGVAYDEYIDQLSLLVFIKMAAELEASLPDGTRWADLIAAEDGLLLDAYSSNLKILGEQVGLVGEVFEGARSQFRSPAGLRSVLRLIDGTNWSSLGRDVQGAAFEYLVERTAAEGKQGAGQYFTPRPVVDAVVECLKPGLRASDKRIGDPACGTGGFLVRAHNWLQAADDASDAIPTYAGSEIVPRVRRLALMNLIVHGVTKPSIELGDALSRRAHENTYDVIMTNPPFGARGGARPERASFWLRTGNKQLNFLQHVLLSLKPGGRAAVVVSDACFSGDRGAAVVWRRIFREARVHTILRLPKGTFAPYTSGIMTNVVFLTKGEETSETWIYDARTDRRVPTARAPLSRLELAEFVRCYGSDPDGAGERSAGHSSGNRWARHDAADLLSREFRLNASTSAGDMVPRQELDDLLLGVESDLLAALASLRRFRGARSGGQ